MTKNEFSSGSNGGPSNVPEPYMVFLSCVNYFLAATISETHHVNAAAIQKIDVELYEKLE